MSLKSREAEEEVSSRSECASATAGLSQKRLGARNGRRQDAAALAVTEADQSSILSQIMMRFMNVAK